MQARRKKPAASSEELRAQSVIMRDGVAELTMLVGGRKSLKLAENFVGKSRPHLPAQPPFPRRK